MEKSSFVPPPPDESLDVDTTAADRALSAADLKVRRKIDELADLTKEPNWDDERGLTIARSEWERAWEFYLRLRTRGVPPPFIAPCGDGSIHFDWTNAASRTLNIEIKDGAFWSTTREADDSRQDEKCGSLAELELKVVQYFLK